MYTAKLIAVVALVIGAVGGFVYTVSSPAEARSSPPPVQAIQFQQPQPQMQMAGVNCYLPGGGVIPLAPMPGGWWAGASPNVSVMAYRILADWFNPTTMMTEKVPLWYGMVNHLTEWASGAGPDAPTPVLTGHYLRLANPMVNNFERVSFTIR